MTDLRTPPTSDPDVLLDEIRDPEAPHLTDLDNPPPEPGTDIVPPERSEPGQRREGVVSDPDLGLPPA
jgi:hypothetical protein